MRITFFIAISLVLLGANHVRAADSISYDQLEAGFHHPPPEARPLTFWMWMNGNISKEGITADLEAFARAGLGGTQQFIVGGTESPLDDPSLPFMSPRWRELEKFAIQESARLGLDFGTHNTPGWSSSGGPWVTPAQSMQKIIFGEMAYRGPGEFHGKLPTGAISHDYYGDIAVLAFPKTGDGKNIEASAIVDVTKDMAADGSFSFTGKGDWIILRVGHTTTGKTNAAAPTSATGLEVDKMSKEALDAYYRGYPELLLADAGKFAGNTFKRLEIDSYEAGLQDWTPHMREEFQKRRGYDMLRFLPALTKRNILDAGGMNLSPRFQYDLNETIAELFTENYYGHMQELVHKTPGLELMVEPYATAPGEPFNTNDLAGVPDVPAAEFWQRPSVWGWSSVKPVTSGAHTYGKAIVAAESFTGQPNYAWQSDPYLLKATSDRAYALGVNRLVYHTSAHQPWLNVAPGMTMGWWGTQFGRTVTWWEHGAKEWIDYQSRCQYLLQQGQFIGDLCYLEYSRVVPAIPTGYDGDCIGPDLLLSQMSYANGRFTLPSGMSYRLLVLPDRATMTPQIARKLKELVSAGGTILGPKPAASPSLENFPACDQEVAAIAGELWGDADGKTTTDHIYGKGHVYWGVKPEQVLANLGDVPDVLFTPGVAATAAAAPGPGDLLWIHRSTHTLEYYFISNQTDHAISTQASFGLIGRYPELWHPESDTIEAGPVWQNEPRRTRVPLVLPPSGSVFVVFRYLPGTDPNQVTAITRDGKPYPADMTAHLASSSMTPDFVTLIAHEPGIYEFTYRRGPTHTVEVAPLPTPLDLSSDWQVTFPPKLGAPEKITLDKLMNLSEHPFAGVKYFSGTATYAKQFDLPDGLLAADRHLTLDLGTVKNIAEVRLNGSTLPLMWLPPFACDITAGLKPGKNSLEIQVTNLWINRLVGDEQLPDDQQWGDIRSMNINRVDVPIGRDLLRVPDWIQNPATRPSQGRITFSTFKYFTKDSPLPPSGLIGPVTISIRQELEIRQQP